MLKLYGYKRCSTCRKAEDFLSKHKVKYQYIDLVESPPSQTMLKKILKLSGQPLKKMFNTSGQVYREEGLKDRMETLTQAEGISMLADNGKLIKRPIVFDGEQVTIGFREEEYEKTWKKKNAKRKS